jgi:hypothetical protein
MRNNILLSGLSPTLCCSESFVVLKDVSLIRETSFDSHGLGAADDLFKGSSLGGIAARRGESGERLSTFTTVLELSLGPGREWMVGVRNATSDCDRV